MLIFLLFMLAVSEAADQVGFDCPRCDDQHNICVTQLQPEDCPPQSVYQDHVTVCGCCPGCVNYTYVLDDGVTCPQITTDHSSNSKGVPRIIITECKPGFRCNNDTKQCEAGTTDCWRNEADQILHWKPECLENGDFAPRQCKGDEIGGRCFCVDPNGTRIFGQMWWSEAENMTCACSRKVAELKLQNRTDVSLHCSEDGNFEPLQCFDGLCYCADEKTGKAVSTILPEQLWTQLPCYNKETVGSGYLRICESIYVAQERIRILLRNSGVTTVHFDQPNCDPDGSYGAIQCKDGSCYCSKQDEQPIYPSFNAEASQRNAMNCNCARDYLWFENHGKAQVQNCLGNGNYNPMQKVGDECYCVDPDGFRLKPEALCELCTPPATP